MTREEFDGMVRGVEKRFADRPEALRSRVILLAALGYAGLLGWLGIIVLISAGFFALMLWVDLDVKIACGILGIAVLLGGSYAVLRALLVRVSKPEGRTVTRREVPELFSMLDELQASLQSQPFHEVLITPVCNAAVMQVPRLGVFGWQRNYLLLGLLLLDGLSRDEMRAVLAHEFTHLSRQHGRITHWLYRLRRSWQEVFQRLSAPRARNELSLRPLVVKFTDFFWPRFNAHAFVLSRANEYEADAQSARLAGTAAAGSALMRLNIVTRQLNEKLWPDIFRLANEQAEPPPGIFGGLRDAIRTGPSAEDSTKWLAEGLQMASTNSDTHPCLTERLRALGVSPAQMAPALAVPSSAEILLGSAVENIRGDVRKLWSKEMASQWRDRYARASALKDRLTSLEQSNAPIPAADVDRLWDKAAALLDLEGPEAATPVLQHVLELRPDHALAHFHLGRLLLEDKSAQGVIHLERAMELDQQYFPKSCQLLHHHYRLTGQQLQMRQVESRMDRYEKSLQASHAERREVTAADSFIQHDLTEAELQRIRALLEPELRVSRADLARKELKHFPDQRLFVLCVYSRRAWHGFSNHDLDRALINRLSKKLQLPGRLMIFSPSGSFRAISRKIACIPRVEIFRREK